MPGKERDMTVFAKRLRIAATLLVALCAIPLARAAGSPAAPCSLLPAADASKALGHAYAPPQKHVAPAPYKNTAEGTDCEYTPTGLGTTLTFRVYFDHSASEATDLFARMRMFFTPQTVLSGVGDEA
jgi:hypothetical protein